MEIVELKILTDAERESLNSIPEEYINRLKKLTIEQQCNCIFIRKVTHDVDVLVKSKPVRCNEFETNFELSRCELQKVYVYDGVIIAVLDEKNRLIKFGTAYLEKETVTYTYMDSHDHGIYNRTESIEFRYYLIIYQNHEYLTNSTEGNSI